MVRNSLKELLDLFPQFYYRGEDGNHYRYTSVIAKVIRDIQSSIGLLDKGFDLDRPVKLWRKQTQDYLYDICYEINLEDIKRVKLYLDEHLSPNLLEGIGLAGKNLSTGGVELNSTEGLECFNGVVAEVTGEWSVFGDKSFKISYPGLSADEAVYIPEHDYFLPVNPGDERSGSFYIKGEHDPQDNLAVLNVATATNSLADTSGFYRLNSCTIKSTTTEHYLGTRSLEVMLYEQTSDSHGVHTDFYGVDDPVGVYTTGMWVKAPEGYQGWLYTYEYDSERVLLDSNIVSWTGTGEWQYITSTNQFSGGYYTRAFVGSAGGCPDVTFYVGSVAIVKDTEVHGDVNLETGCVEQRLDLTLVTRDINKVLIPGESKTVPVVLSQEPQRVSVNFVFTHPDSKYFNIGLWNTRKYETFIYLDGVMFNNGSDVLDWNYPESYSADVLKDSGELTPGINKYDGCYNDEEKYVKTPYYKHYYLEVETWNEEFYTKGFPENKEVTGDKYDSDLVLDVLGEYYGIPRRYHKTGIEEVEYPYTYPPYCLDEKEWDYTYENRICEHMNSHKELTLVESEVKKYYNIIPNVSGRWRYLCRQNISDMAPILDAQYMATKEWNSGVFNVTTDLNQVPTNIKTPTVEEMQSLVDKTFPLGKKGYFQLTDHYPGVTDPPLTEYLNMVEDIKYHIIPPSRYVNYYDTVKIDATLPVATEVPNFYDRVTLGLKSMGWDVSGWYDNLGITGYIPALRHTTDTDFASDILTDALVSGTGAEAIVKLDTGLKSKSDTPSTQAQTGTGWDWVNPGNAVDTSTTTYAMSEKPAGDTGYITKHSTAQASVYDGNPSGGGHWLSMDRVEANDGSGAYASATTTYRNTNLLRLTGFGFNVPADATIKGVVVHVERKTSTSVSGTRDYKVRLVYNSSQRGDNKASTDSLEEYYITKTYGGSTDDWNASLTPSIVNSSSFGVDISYYNGTVYNPTFYVDYVDITVYWEIPSPYTNSKNLELTGLGVTLPTNSEVVGVAAVVKCYASTTEIVLNTTVTVGGVSKTKTALFPTTASNLTIGGGDDLWGGLPTTPSSYGSVKVTLYPATSYEARIYYVTLYVYYKLTDGTLMTGTITAPAGGVGWEELISDETKPTGTSILWDVIKASDGTVLLSNKTTPVNISGLGYVDLQVKAKLHTDNLSYYPQINSFMIRYEKNIK